VVKVVSSVFYFFESDIQFVWDFLSAISRMEIAFIFVLSSSKFSLSRYSRSFAMIS